MSDQTIIAALQTRLAAFASTKGLSVAFEGIPPGADIPSATKMHLADHLLPATTQDPSLGRQHRRYTGIYQVDVDSPAAIPGATTAPAVALRNMANGLVDHFARGTSVTRSGITVLIVNTPSLSPLLIDGGRMKRAVSIRYQADVITS